MKYLIFIAAFLWSTTLDAQIKPEIFPEDIHPGQIQSRCFCKPGVRNKSRSKGILISYGRVGNGAYDPEDGSFSQPFSSYNSLQQLELDLKVPLIISDSFKLLIGYKYYQEGFQFKEFGADFEETFRELDREQLKSNSLSFIISKPLNETRYLAFRFRYSSNGDYNKWISFDQRYAIYKFLGIYAIKPHEDFEWGVGLHVSKSFRRNNILPFVILNKNFNERWGIESVLPGFIYGRFNINPSNIFLFGIEYNSQSYRVDFTDTNTLPLAYAYNHSEVITSMTLERRFSSWVWGNLQLGYQLNFSSDFEAQTDFTTTFTADPSNALFFRIGIFVSPPD